ncbi:MAG TPA: phosphotransferase [Ktedonobacteraceae bacterium]|nr:phosphotransferase [Ktedonobacteraceae bacterium]
MTQEVHDHNVKQKLADIARHFELGSITSTPRRAMGTNQNYFITTTRGQFLVKLIVNAPLEEIAQGLPYLDRLEEYDFPAAAYYIKAPDGSAIYENADTCAVVLRKLKGKMPELSTPVSKEAGMALARLHLIPADGLPPKRHWIDNNYLPEAIELARKTLGDHELQQTLDVYASFKDFKPKTFPQSIVHGDLDLTNCLFVGNRLSAMLDWQEVGVGASILDFAMGVLGFCFVESTDPEYRGTFDPQLYKAFYAGYSQVRPLSQAEQDAIETAVKYAGLTQPVWSMLYWDQYHTGVDLVETNTLYWRFGLDTWTLPSF